MELVENGYRAVVNPDMEVRSSGGVHQCLTVTLPLDLSDTAVTKPDPGFVTAVEAALIHADRQTDRQAGRQAVGQT